MSWDNVPWFVGGGATHSPEVARLLAYAATSGAEGIVTPGDLKIAPLAVPGASIRVLAGACLILNRNAAGAQQTYVGRNPSEDVKGVAATGSGSGRNDLVIAQIKDPFLPGEPWAVPANVTVGPYIFTEIVPNVPLSATVSNAAAAAHLRTLGVTGIPLAAVVLPVSTGTITANEIKDLRRIATPRRERVHYRLDGPNGQIDHADLRNLWNWVQVDVPAWATEVILRGELTGLQHLNSAFAGVIGTRIGSANGPKAETGLTYINEQIPGNSRKSYFASGRVTIPAAVRGTRQDFTIFGSRIGGTGVLLGDSTTQLIFDAEFIESAA